MFFDDLRKQKQEQAKAYATSLLVRTIGSTSHLPNKEQIMHLTYRVEGAWLVTDQPSSPQEQRSEFFFTREGQLAVKNESTDPPTLYARQSLP